MCVRINVHQNRKRNGKIHENAFFEYVDNSAYKVRSVLLFIFIYKSGGSPTKTIMAYFALLNERNTKCN